MRAAPVAALLAALLGMLSCAARETAAPPTATPLPEPIAAEIGDAACTGHAQCRTVPIGHKACGGPEHFAAWSITRSHPERLAMLAERHAAERRALAERSGMASNCMVVPDPGAQCVANRCVLRPRGGTIRQSTY